MMRALLLLSLLAAPARALTPADAATFAWAPHPGAQVPLGVILRDEAGTDAALATRLSGRPVILDIGYYRCPSLCGVVRADLLAALRGSGLVEGADYTLVALSIDPEETARDAARAKSGDLSEAPFTSGTDWHYLTGDAGATGAIADSVGFHDRLDAASRQFIHPAGLVVLTPTGIVSSYLLGVGYTGGDLRSAILRARAGRLAQASSPILLLCFHYDAATGRYTLAIEKLLRLMAVLTVVTLATMLTILHRRRPKVP